MTSKIEQAIEANAQLVELIHKQASLTAELGKSLRIMKVWPEAFKDGCSVSINTFWTGGCGNKRTASHSLVRSDGVSCKITAHDLDFIRGNLNKK